MTGHNRNLEERADGVGESGLFSQMRAAFSGLAGVPWGPPQSTKNRTALGHVSDAERSKRRETETIPKAYRAIRQASAQRCLGGRRPHTGDARSEERQGCARANRRWNARARAERRRGKSPPVRRPRDTTDRDAPQRRSTSRPGTEKARNPGNEGSHPGGRQRGLPGRPGRDIRDGQVSRWTGRREGGQQQGSCPSGGMTPRRKEKKKNGTEKLSQWGV